jgi:hypothetical protein
LKLKWVSVLLLLAPGLAHAQFDGGVADGGPPPVDEAEIQRALQADQEAQQKKLKPASVSSPTAAPAPAQSPSPLSSFGRFIQSLNPDIAAIVDFAAGWYSNDQVVKSGDDPAKSGFNAQEIEVALQAVVDPYFRADIFLTIPNLQGIEVEEAFATTTHLPANFQVKAGIFRAGYGRQNTQHLHMQDFTRRPVVNALFLGIDGLRAPGLEINWLVPRIPFYLLFAYSMFSVDPAASDTPLASFGGGKRYDFAYLATAKAFWELSEATSLYVGLNYAHGKTSQSSTMSTVPGPPVPSAATPYDNWYDHVFAGDLYLKWKPPNATRTWTSIAWQTEYFLRWIPDLLISGVKRPQLEGGLYSQIVLQVARRWYLGLRGEIVGIPNGDNVRREYAGAASVTFAMSEFARLRLYGEARYPWGAAVNGFGLPRYPVGNGVNGAGFAQLEIAIGAHGAHPF